MLTINSLWPRRNWQAKVQGDALWGKTDYQARGVLYLPEASRFSKLLILPEGADIGKVINEAMRAIEVENEELKDSPAQDL